MPMGLRDDLQTTKNMKTQNKAINSGIMAGSELATAVELAQICKVSRRTVDNWTAERLIPFFKIGAAVRFNVPEVMAAISRFKVEPINQ